MSKIFIVMVFLVNIVYASTCSNSAKRIVYLLNNKPMSIAVSEIEEKFTRCYHALNNNSLEDKVANKILITRNIKRTFKAIVINLGGSIEDINDISSDNSSIINNFLTLGSLANNDSKGRELTKQLNALEKSFKKDLKGILTNMYKE